MRVAVRLRAALAERKLSPKHAQDLLAAFRLDVTKLRYRDWDDLIGYCSLSAMPVGRFVLRRAWREPHGMAGQRCAVRGIADHQSSAGLHARITATSTASMFRSMRLRRGRHRVEALGADASSPAAACAACTGSQRAPSAAQRERRLPGTDQRLASRPGSLRHQHAGAPIDAHPGGARSAERSRPSASARGRRPDAGRRLRRRVAPARPAIVRRCP